MGFLFGRVQKQSLTERPSSEKWPWTRNLRQKLKDDGVLTKMEIACSSQGTSSSLARAQPPLLFMEATPTD